MMKSWSRLGFLVLAISALSRGQNGSTAALPDEDRSVTKEASTPPPTPAPGPVLPQTPMDETKNESTLIKIPPSYRPHLTNESFTTPGGTVAAEETDNHTGNNVNFTDKDINGSATTQSRQMPTSARVPGSDSKDDGVDDVTTMVATTTDSASSKPAPIGSTDQSSWGYVILAFIIVAIIALCIILYLLRRANRTYSFDLQRPVHVNHLDEPTGTFEPVYLDDLAPQDQETTDDLSPPPVANGTTPQTEEKSCNGENAAREQPDANGLEASLTSNTSPTLGDEPAEKTSSPLSSTNLLFDAIGDEQQNENNNNPSVYSSDPFVEINLDDPAWCDQFLTSPEAPSSVLPFSPFSFSSSSSSS